MISVGKVGDEVLIQQFPSEHAVRITHAEALNLVERLLDELMGFPAPEMQYTITHNDGEPVEHELTCPHCCIVFGDGETPVFEIDYGQIRMNEAELVGDGLHPTESGERDYHTLAWMCANCECPVSIPNEIEVTYS